MDWRAQIALVDEVAGAIASTNPSVHVDVQYGPNGVQWCSQPMLEAIANVSADNNRRVHMHLLETSLQRKWADEQFPDGIVRYLKDIGLLTPRLTLAHCVWARPDELEMIAESGSIIAVNPSSNLALFSGIAPVREMMAKGVDVCLGLDGCTLDEDDDALRELRLLRLLNAGYSFGSGVRGTELLRIACSNGRRALGLGPGGTIESGMPADLLLIDAQAIDKDALAPVDFRELLFARGNTGHIRTVIGNGRTIVEDGKLMTIDLKAAEEELRCYYRAALGDQAAIAEAWNAVEPALARFNRDWAGCE